MPKRNIDIEIELTGEKAYKQALDNAASSVRLLGLQVKENATAYKQNADSAEGNRERIALLKKEIEAQQKVIDLDLLRRATLAPPLIASVVLSVPVSDCIRQRHSS